MNDALELGYVEGQLGELKTLHQRVPGTVNEVLEVMEKELELFIDLIPGYKIRPPDSTPGQKVVHTKVFRSVQRLEQSLLAYYRRYLTHLLRMRKAADPAVKLQAYEALCKLLRAAAHFNFSSSLINAVVHGCNEPFDDAARLCVEALEEMFDLDGTGDASLKALNLITLLVKQQKHTVNPALVATLIHMKIAAVDVDRTDTEQRKRAHMKDHKKMTEEDRKIQQDLDRAQATPDQVQRRRNMTWILQRMMAVLLRVLEVAQDANGIRQHRLLVPVLEGVTKFAPLLDAHMLHLLLTAIRDLLNLSHIHPLTALNAVVACATLTEAAEMATVHTNAAGDEFTTSAVAVDFGPAYGHLYRIIPKVLATPHARDLVSFRRERAQTIKKATKAAPTKAGLADDTMSLASSMVTTVDLSHEYINASAERNRRVALLLQACEILLLKPKYLPRPRVCAFAKILALHAAHQPPHIAMALVGFVRQLTQRRPYLADLMAEGPDGNMSTGVYNAGAEEPDHAHAEGAIFWEWCLLAKSYHPHLARYAPVVLKTAAELRDPIHRRDAGLKNEAMAGVSALLHATPTELLQQHDPSLGAFAPPVQEPPTKRRKGALPEPEA